MHCCTALRKTAVRTSSSSACSGYVTDINCPIHLGTSLAHKRIKINKDKKIKRMFEILKKTRTTRKLEDVRKLCGVKLYPMKFRDFSPVSTAVSTWQSSSSLVWLRVRSRAKAPTTLKNSSAKVTSERSVNSPAVARGVALGLRTKPSVMRHLGG